ncbi:MAG: cupin fold metalloprotein, WbuC family [Nevskiaceae bacterium]|nr:MAG: cupin fold metalloprotein, WbuC family [Nevskiaceae bacterium]
MNPRTISQDLLADLAQKAEASPRLRTHFNFHEGPASLVQRLIVQLGRGTYIRPHRHIDLNKWEMTLALSGTAEVLLFEDDGALRERVRLSPGGAVVALELPPQTWHSYVPQGAHAAFFEIKEGPYDPARITQFAPWAPAEGEAAVADYLRWMTKATPGSRYAA